MTAPSNEAIAQAFIGAVQACAQPLTSMPAKLAATNNFLHLLSYANRARELDAENGGVPHCHKCRVGFTPDGCAVYMALENRQGFAVCEMCDGSYGPWDEVAAFDKPGDDARFAAENPPATPPAQAAEAVERVARAIAGADRDDKTVFDKVSPRTREDCRVLARAAIAAMQAGEESK